jgi:hypothetical protein
LQYKTSTFLIQRNETNNGHGSNLTKAKRVGTKQAKTKRPRLKPAQEKWLGQNKLKQTLSG